MEESEVPLAGEASEMGVVEKTESPLHQRVERLEELLRRSPWNTSLYEECVQALEALGRIDESRRMKLRWLKFRVVDEETLLQWLAAAGWGTDFALTLLRQALKQQPSVSLYLSYVRHLEAASGNVLENAGVAHVRAAWEEAVSEFQLHALEAPRLWMGYRAFEMQIQQLLQLKKKQLELQVEERLAGGAASQSKENSSSASPPVPPALLEAVSEAAAAVSAQNRRIRRLFFRQLQLPLGGLGDLLDEYSVWEAETTGSAAAFAVGAELHARGAAAWKAERKDFEMEIQAAAEQDEATGSLRHTIKAWRKYIAEESLRGPSRGLVTFLRALEEIGEWTSDLWLQAAQFAASTGASSAVANAKSCADEGGEASCDDVDAASASDGVDEEAAQDAKAAEKAVSRLEVSAHRLLLRKERQILERGLRLFPSDVRLWERLFACLASHREDGEAAETEQSLREAKKIADLSAGTDEDGDGPVGRQRVFALRVEVAFSEALLSFRKNFAAADALGAQQGEALILEATRCFEKAEKLLQEMEKEDLATVGEEEKLELQRRLRLVGTKLARDSVDLPSLRKKAMKFLETLAEKAPAEDEVLQRVEGELILALLHSQSQSSAISDSERETLQQALSAWSEGSGGVSSSLLAQVSAAASSLGLSLPPSNSARLSSPMEKSSCLPLRVVNDSRQSSTESAGSVIAGFAVERDDGSGTEGRSRAAACLSAIRRLRLKRRLHEADWETASDASTDSVVQSQQPHPPAPAASSVANPTNGGGGASSCASTAGVAAASSSVAGSAAASGVSGEAAAHPASSSASLAKKLRLTAGTSTAGGCAATSVAAAGGLSPGARSPRGVSSRSPSPAAPFRGDIERITRATWSGMESADPSLAPAVPPPGCVSSQSNSALSSPRNASSSSPALSPRLAPLAAPDFCCGGGLEGGRRNSSSSQSRGVSHSADSSLERSTDMPPPPFTPRRTHKRGASASRTLSGASICSAGAGALSADSDEGGPSKRARQNSSQVSSKPTNDDACGERRRRAASSEGEKEGAAAAAAIEAEEASSTSESASKNALRSARGEFGNSDGEADSQERGQASLTPHVGRHFLQKKLAGNLGDLKEVSSPTEAVQCAAAAFLREETQDATLWISNLDASVTKTQLEEFIRKNLESPESLVEVRLVCDFRGKSKGFAYADFASPRDAEKASSALHHLELNERPLKALVSRPTQDLFQSHTLFLRGLSPEATEESTRSGLEALGFENISGVRVIRDSGGQKSKGYAYLDFIDKHAAAAALERFLERARRSPSTEGEEMHLDGRPFVLAPSIPMKNHRWIRAPSSKIEKRKQRNTAAEAVVQPGLVFVKNLNFKTDEEALKKHFEELAQVQVEEVVVCRNEQGRSKGFGFLKLADDAAVMGALMLNDSSLDNRRIIVSRSTRPLTTPKTTEREEASGDRSDSCAVSGHSVLGRSRHHARIALPSSLLSCKRLSEERTEEKPPPTGVETAAASEGPAENGVPKTSPSVEK